MKRMKKVVSLIMALAMVLAIAVPVMAEGTTYTITINNEDEGHIYEAYQIFKGELHGSVLSDIEWGDGITDDGQAALQNTAGVESAAAVAAKLENESSAKQFADVVSGYLTSVPTGTSTAGNDIYTISDLEPGYYLIKDQDGSLAGKDTTYTEYMIKIVKNIAIDPKDSEATFEKKVEDCNDSIGRTTVWQDSADYDIGDNVPFQLKATLPANVESFNTYKVVFHDTLSAGLSYAADAKVFVDGHEKTTSFTITQQPGENGTTTLTISCENVKADAIGAINGSEIRVNYTAKLNKDAVIGGNGNPNTAYLEYSNNPNATGTGQTVEDKVVVFTYKVVINKVTEDNEPLVGAEFKLEKKISGAERKLITTIKAENGSTFSFVGLDDGTYILTETNTPDGFNSIAPIEFTISAEHDVNSVEPKLLTLAGGDRLSGEVSTGVLTGNVVNESGATLPETGGMGTTLFYILGAILVIGAGVALVTRKRMS